MARTADDPHPDGTRDGSADAIDALDPTVDERTLDDQLCFALYAASRAMVARYRPHLQALGLTYPQYLVLVVLCDDGVSTVSHLGERLRLDSGTLSPLLQRLEAAGHVTRTRRPGDERSVEVRVTAAGRRLRREAGGVTAAIGDALGPLGDADVVAGLRRLEVALRAI